MHVVLLGDSTIDNVSYTDGGMSVVDHLSRMLKGRGTATLVAVDGAMTSDIPDQLREIPESCTVIVLSVGGNDALMQVDMLTQPAERVWDALIGLASVLDDFERDYRSCLQEVLSLGIPTVVCAIYNGAFDEATGEQTVVATALRTFNDVIYQIAFDYGLPVIDLRRVCDSRSDFANPIEPNHEGGRKIASAIRRTVEAMDGRSFVFPIGPRQQQ